MNYSSAKKQNVTKRGILLVALLLIVCTLLFSAVACGGRNGGGAYILSVSDDFKTQYYVGESFAASGTLTVKRSDGTVESYPISADMVTDFDTSSAGDVIVKITYGEYSTTMPIRVLALSATSITLDEDTLPEVIYQNDPFPDGVTLSVKMSDDSSKTVTVTSSMLAGFDSSRIGTQNVTVTYLDASFPFTVTVKQDERVSISLVSAKAQYEVGESLSTSGTSIAVLYESGKVSPVAFTADLVSGFSTELGGEYVAKVTYKEFTCNYPYSVRKYAVLLEVDQDTLPDLYEIGDTFPTSGRALLTYNDGTTEEISLTAEHAAAFTTETFGEKNVKITVSGAADDYSYEVLPAIRNATPFGFTGVVAQGSAFDGFGELIVEYENEETETIDFTSPRLTLVKFDTETVGEVQQILRFRTREIPFVVVVYPEEERDAVEGIVLSGGAIPSVKLGDPIDPSAIQVTILYKYLDSSTVYCKSDWVTVEMPEEIEGDYQDLLVTVTYKGASAETWVRVLSEEFAAKVTSLRREGVWKSLYLVGDEASYDELFFAATYGNGYKVLSSIPLSAEGVEVEGFDTSVAGEKTMTVRYQGASFTADYRVIDEADLDRVTSVALYGFNPLVFVGDSIDDLLKEGDYVPSVTLTYGYGYRTDLVDLELSMLSGTLTQGECELTLTYEDVTAPVFVTVHPADEKGILTATRVSALVQATVGAMPDFSRYDLELIYGYGYEVRKIPLNSQGITISEFTTTQGMRHVWVDYAVQDKVFRCDAFISFAYGSGENVLERIEVTEGADKEFAVGDTLSGVKIHVYYLNGNDDLIDVTPEMIEGFSTEQAGSYETTIVYGDKTAPYSYTVVEPEEEEQEPEQQQSEQQQGSGQQGPEQQQGSGQQEA